MNAPALARHPRGLSAVAWMPWAIGLVTALLYQRPSHAGFGGQGTPEPEPATAH